MKVETITHLTAYGLGIATVIALQGGCSATVETDDNGSVTRYDTGQFEAYPAVGGLIFEMKDQDQSGEKPEVHLAKQIADLLKDNNCNPMGETQLPSEVVVFNGQRSVNTKTFVPMKDPVICLNSIANS